MVEWSEASEEEFAALPRADRSAADRAWDQLFDALADGKLVRLPYADDADRKRKRLALGRRAAARGLKLEVRAGDGAMVARAIHEPKAPRHRQQEAR